MRNAGQTMEPADDADHSRAGRVRRRRRSREISRYAGKPIRLLWRYVSRHKTAHILVLTSVLIAVGCALASQFGIRNLIDALPTGRSHPGAVIRAFTILVVLILADNLFWRIGGWTAARAFVNVTGDVRNEMFGYLSAHAPVFFADKQPGVLASRVSAMANAVYTIQNIVAWTALPPCLNVVGAIAMVAIVSAPMSLALVAVSGALALGLFRLASKGTARHQAFAAPAASVDGELVDVIGNVGLVRSFSAVRNECQRLDTHLGSEGASRTESLLYLEKLRLLHSIATALFSSGLLGWTLRLWTEDRATTGDVVLISSLGFAILHGTRDLAVALVDLTQHIARLGEATQTLLVPHEMVERGNTQPLQITRATVEFENVSFAYSGRRPVLSEFNLHIRAGERVGLMVHLAPASPHSLP
jgi:ATP-binding cassette subfamily B protein